MYIITKIKGGLGNQLFAYAAAKRLAIKNNVELLIDNTSGFNKRDRYNRSYLLDSFAIEDRKASYFEKLEPLGRIRRSIKKYLSKNLPFDNRSYLTQEGIDFDERLLNFRVKQNTYIEGYWQSQNYFLDVQDKIRSNLKMKLPNDKYCLSMYDKIKSCNSVAVHFRDFTIHDATVGINLTKEYYKKAIAFYENNYELPFYFFFSDSTNFLKNLDIDYPQNRSEFLLENINKNNDYLDLWLMSNCKHFVIANSTFSWWGAWLSQNKNKQVISPNNNIRYGVNYWGFRGLIPNSWKII